MLCPGVWVAEVHGVQHVVVRGSARHISPRHPWTLHWPLLYEKKSTSCKAPHNAGWISEQVTNHLFQCHMARTLITYSSETLVVSTVGARQTWRWVPY